MDAISRLNKIKSTNLNNRVYPESPDFLSQLNESVQGESAHPSRSGHRRWRAESQSQQTYRLVALNAVDPKEAEEIASLILKYTRNDGAPAIYHAAKENDLDAVKTLLAYGGDPTMALSGALRGKSITLLKYLVEDAKTPLSNSDWLTYWNDTKWWEGFDYLISRGAKIPYLNSYLYFNCPDLLKELINRGAKFSSDFNAGQAYQIIIFSKDFAPDLRVRIFETLRKECNPPVNHLFGVYHQFPNPKWIYSRHGWVPLLRSEGNTVLCSPLQFAVLNEDLPLATALLKAGADPNIENCSPLKCAKDRQNKAMMALLISYGAKVDGV